MVHFDDFGFDNSISVIVCRSIINKFRHFLDAWQLQFKITEINSRAISMVSRNSLCKIFQRNVPNYIISLCVFNLLNV